MTAVLNGIVSHTYRVCPLLTLQEEAVRFAEATGDYQIVVLLDNIQVCDCEWLDHGRKVQQDLTVVFEAFLVLEVCRHHNAVMLREAAYLDIPDVPDAVALDSWIQS